MAKALLITGATGKQGGAVIDALLSQAKTSPQPNPNPFTVLAVTRDPSSAASQRLLRKSNPDKGLTIHLVQGNLDDVPALFTTAKKVLSSTTSTGTSAPQVYGVFSVQVSLGPGVTVQGEINQGKSLIDGAIAHGVRHFVYSSVERGGDQRSWSNTTPIPHFQTKYVIEHHLRDVSAIKTLGGDHANNSEDENGTAGENSEHQQQQQHMEWTILRPVAFMDNLARGMPTKVFLAAMKNHIEPRQKKVQWVATRDIGIFAAKAFIHPQEWKGRAVGIAGDELDMQGLDRSFMRATGRNVPLGYAFMGSILTWAVKEVGLMIGWFAEEGYKADVAARRQEHPGMLTMEMWLALEDSPFAAGDTN